MSKRAANNYLTHDNWDVEEDEPEEAGMFKSASDDVLQRRTIKKARRRIQGDNEEDNANKNAFAGFTFGTISSTSDSNFKLPPFTTNSKPQRTEVQGGSVETENKSNGAPAVSSSSLKVIAAEPTSGAGLPSGNLLATPTTTSDFKLPSAVKKSETPEEAYLKQMMHLNECFVKWITDNVAKSPDCILTPCFEDYNSYVAKIDKDYPIPSSESDVQKKPTNPFPRTITSNNSDLDAKDKTNPNSADGSEKPFTFGSMNFGSNDQHRVPAFGVLTNKLMTSPAATNQDVDTSDQKEQQKVDLTLNKGEATTSSFVTSTSSKFTFGTSSEVPFSFGAGTTFPTFGGGLFSKAKAPESSNEAAGSAQAPGDEEYEPPKSEVVEINEEGAFYSVRCKLFYKEDDKFQERGLGFLYLIPNGTKTQLLVRTDTTLGNILLNINIEKAMPVSRNNEKYVTIICIANPPIDPKSQSNAPTPMLIRVKSSQEADELYAQITRCQSKM